MAIEQAHTSPHWRCTDPMTRWTIVAPQARPCCCCTQHWWRWRCCRWWRQKMVRRVLLMMLIELMGAAYGSVYSSAATAPLAAAVRWRWGGGVTEGPAIAGPMGFAVEPKGFWKRTLRRRFKKYSLVSVIDSYRCPIVSPEILSMPKSVRDKTQKWGKQTTGDKRKHKEEWRERLVLLDSSYRMNNPPTPADHWSPITVIELSNCYFYRYLSLDLSWNFSCCDLNSQRSCIFNL